MRPPRVLVTGAGGFIGRWSVPPLLQRGYEVHAAVSPDPARPVPAQLRGATLHRADLAEPERARALVAALSPTHLLHFAWIATPGVYGASEDNYRWLAAGRALLAGFLAAGGRRAVAAGSSAEYAPTGAGLCVEGRSALADSAGAPAASPYAACKLALQREWESEIHRSGASGAWGRIFFQFGPSEHPDRLVASVIRALLSRREALCTHGRQIRGFMHVADVGAAFAALLDSAVEGPVNIGADRSISIAGLIDVIAAQIGLRELVRLGARPAPAGEPGVLVADARRLREEVGFAPRFDLETGLADAIAWWREELRG